MTDQESERDGVRDDGVTLYALSTGVGRAALAVVRLTGPDSAAVLQALLGKDQSLPRPRQAGLRRLYHPDRLTLLDEALVVRFAAPHSYTGEDMVELHVHGGSAVIASLVEALRDMPASIAKVSAAQGGDFTRRAVLNGKMDLTQAEAIADLIDAEGGAQQGQALTQMGGALGRQMQAWRDRLSAILAHIEADIEFADEDLPGGIGQAALGELTGLRAALAAHGEDRRGIALRDGLRIALLGPPNAGKSSILNMLAGREAAIVSARAGTTRDVIEVAMVLDGVPLTLVDTAGLRRAGDDIEREGVRRAGQQASAANIRLLVISPDTVDALASLADVADAASALQKPDLTICNKADLGPIKGYDGLPLSTKDETGQDALLAALQRLVADCIGHNEAPIITRERHRAVLMETLSHIDRAVAAAQAEGVGLELAAEDVRLAQRSLGRLTGAVDVEQLLDIVFADFCIGK